MQPNILKTADNAEGQLNSGINASAISIPLKSGEGAEFPTTYSGTTTSTGDSTTLNKTGIGASGIAVGDFVQNTTDGSHAYVLAVNTDSLTTSALLGGSDNTWQSGDTYIVNSFVVTLNSRDSAGNITASEKVLIDTISSDTLTVNASGRGYDGSTAQSWSPDDYVNLFVVSRANDELRKALAEVFQEIDLKASLTYVNAALGQQNWKNSVVAATTGAGTLSSSFENGDTLDGVVLATGDRILIKDQSTASENGIYTVNASGTPTRATDFDETSEITSAVIGIEQGTTNADTVWICTSDSPVVDTDSISFTQFNIALSAASQAEAEAGTNNAKYMTALRVTQLLDALYITQSEAAILVGGASSVADTLHTHETFNEKLQLNTTNVDVVSSTTETALFSITVPANTLGTNNGILFKIFIDVFSSSGSSSVCTIRLKLGATTLATITNQTGAAITSQSGKIEGALVAAGATSSQEGYIEQTTQINQTLANSTVTMCHEFGIGTSSEDSTASKTLTVTAQWNNNSATDRIRAVGSIIEVVRT